jgi:MFS family permease
MNLKQDVRTRLTWLMFFGQSLGSAGFIAGATIGAILGQELSGQTALAGLPGAMYVLGGALAAYPMARFMEHTGRRIGLTLGFGLGSVGAIIAGLAVMAHSFPGFLAGFTLMGASQGATNLARYAAAEMYPLEGRARAISIVVWGGTIGAVTGPYVVKLAEYLRWDPLSSSWFVIAVLFTLGSLLFTMFLRPDPSTLAVRTSDVTTTTDRVRPYREILSQRRTQVAVTAMVVSQLVMVMIMAITSVHMKAHGHLLGDVSIVISAHTLGMFGLSVISGRLADNFGRAPIIVAGAGLLMLACLIAPLSQDTGLIALALFLLGLGWNFCYVAGAALLTDALTLAESGRIQGSNDMLVGMVSAVGNLGSGIVFASLGYTLMGWVSFAVTLVPLALAFNLIVGQSRVRAAEAE